MKMKFNLKYIALLVVVLLIADQALKIWIKTHLALGEGITVFPDWFQLRFIENPGAAFGMRLVTGDGYDWATCLCSTRHLAPFRPHGYTHSRASRHCRRKAHPHFQDIGNY